MKGMDDILENAAIGTWTGAFSRSPAQANAPHETDAELVELPGMPTHHLAVTVDTVAEEMRAGLYREPYTMGWVSVVAALSDLAAVGAEPLGVAVSASVPSSWSASSAEDAAQGMQEACDAAGTHVLGGDLNEAPSVSLTGCAVGLVPADGILTRRGMRPGDALFVSGPLGSGNALGLVRLAGLPDALFPEKQYRPHARLSVGLALRGRASACMDTSDGVLTTLDQLMRLNGVGFDVACDWRDVLSDDVLGLCEETKTPRWMMLGGPHGEFELAFTVPQEQAEAFASDAASWTPAPVRIGTVTERQALTLTIGSSRTAEVDMAPLRNLTQTAGEDPGRYLDAFRKHGSAWNLD